MRDVNDDMDELLRRAANGYPLNTDSADWNKVSDALHAFDGVEDEETNVVLSPKGQNNFPEILLLLILLSIPLVLSNYFLTRGRLLPQPAENFLPDIIQQIPLTSYGKIDDKDNSGAIAIVENKKKNAINSEVITKKQVGEHDFSIYKNGLNNFSHTTGKQKRKPVVELYKDLPGKKEEQNTADRVGKKTAGSKPMELTNNLASNTPAAGKKDNSNNRSDTSTTNETVKKKEIVYANKKKHNWYVGLLGGPDFSTVKFQEINKTGFSAGVLAGFSLGKKFTIETGLLLDKKFYYTDGKYFKPKNISIPPSIEIIDVDGNCDMIEWPINLSYKIKLYRKSTLTANAGISSYFMRKESYSYVYSRNGTLNEWDHTYKNSLNNLFSVINLGIGYSHNLSNSLFLDVRPYIKVPISGIGTGRLPITSSGVYLGIFKRIQ